MTAQLIHAMAKINAIQARLEAMKVFNAIRLEDGRQIGYDSDHFFAAERELEDIAESIRNLL